MRVQIEGNHVELVHQVTKAQVDELEDALYGKLARFVDPGVWEVPKEQADQIKRWCDVLRRSATRVEVNQGADSTVDQVIDIEFGD